MTDEPMEDETEDKAACECGEKDCTKCSPEKPVETKADEEVPAEVPPEAEEDEAEPEEIGPLKRYDHVNVKAPHYKGFGRIESIHTKGHVPHAEQDMMGSKEDPAACVKCYKAMGDGHVATEHHVAAKVAHLSKMAIPMSPPTKKAVEGPVEAKTVRTEPVIEHIEIRVKSDQQVRDELIAKLNQMLSPEGFRKIAREEAERAAGFV